MTELPPNPQPTVDAIWAAREREAMHRPRFDGYGLAASALGSACDRQLWYGLRWSSAHEVLTGRKLRIFERGNIEEQRVIDDLRRAGLEVLDQDEATGRQFSFTLANGWLRGKADGRCWGVLEAPKAEHVIEIKSLKAADWRAIQKHGLLAKKAEHWHQLHAGMAGLGIARGLYVGVNKDTEEILTERIRFDADEAARQVGRVLRIVDAHDAPGRIADDPDSFACRFCQHIGVCHRQEFARRHCRTCINFTFTSDGNGHCERFNEPRRPNSQARTDCPAHLFLPALVPGEQIDANPEAETVTYRMADGSEWIDGKEVDHATA